MTAPQAPNAADQRARSPEDQKRAALAAILDAWEKALGEGVDADMLASTALFAALTDMVDMHGEAAVAEFAETLGPRIRSGEFSMRP
jgi:hypothetical protein